MTPRRKLEQRLRAAIGQFWSTREAQAQKQGVATGAKDAGARAAVTGGAQMNGFISLVRERLYDAACLLMSDSVNGRQGVYREPAPELSFANFASSLLARLIAESKTR